MILRLSVGVLEPLHLLVVTASSALLVVPGPTTALVVARSMPDGHRIAFPLILVLVLILILVLVLVLGVGLGDFLAATVASDSRARRSRQASLPPGGGGLSAACCRMWTTFDSRCRSGLN